MPEWFEATGRLAEVVYRLSPSTKMGTTVLKLMLSVRYRVSKNLSAEDRDYLRLIGEELAAYVGPTRPLREVTIASLPDGRTETEYILTPDFAAFLGDQLDPTLGKELSDPGFLVKTLYLADLRTRLPAPTTDADRLRERSRVELRCPWLEARVLFSGPVLITDYVFTREGGTVVCTQTNTANPWEASVAIKRALTLAGEIKPLLEGAGTLDNTALRLKLTLPLKPAFARALRKFLAMNPRLDNLPDLESLQRAAVEYQARYQKESRMPSLPEPDRSTLSPPESYWYMDPTMFRYGELPPKERLAALEKAYQSLSRDLDLLGSDFTSIRQEQEVWQGRLGDLNKALGDRAQRTDQLAGQREYLMRGIAEPAIALEDVIIADTLRAEILDALAGQEAGVKSVLDEWGLTDAIAYGLGTGFLFYGPPGTGKTALAEGIARHLGKKIWRIGASNFESMFIGQGNKSIVEAFKVAKEQDLVILLDECDSLLMSRDGTEGMIRVSNDVAAGMTNDLLGEIERYEGVIVLTTNRKPVLDAALARRIGLIREVPPPDRAQRERIWQSILARTKAPLSPLINWAAISRYELTGGLIKNAILVALRKAAVRKTECGETWVTEQDLSEGIRVQLADQKGGIDLMLVGYAAQGKDRPPMLRGLEGGQGIIHQRDQEGIHHYFSQN